MKTILLCLIRGYKMFLSPLLPPACRFHPTCADYALEAVKTHGAIKGMGLSVWRVLRCNPYCKGGYDPVPKRHAVK